MLSTNKFWRVQATETVTQFNPEITEAFLKLYQLPDVHKTHLFEGRYENIYLNEQHIPQLTPLINEAISLAENILNMQNLRAGYWFNYMPPGSITLPHTHDDDDELLSGVYYVYVPENSGNLILNENTKKENPDKIEIKPKSGEFIFFKPSIRHEVSKNNSTEHRLSIGMNFGKKD
jgi:hypothetical protein